MYLRLSTTRILESEFRIPLGVGCMSKISVLFCIGIYLRYVRPLSKCLKQFTVSEVYSQSGHTKEPEDEWSVLLDTRNYLHRWMYEMSVKTHETTCINEDKRSAWQNTKLPASMKIRNVCDKTRFNLRDDITAIQCLILLLHMLKVPVLNFVTPCTLVVGHQHFIGVGILPQHYTALQPRRHWLESLPPWKPEISNILTFSWFSHFLLAHSGRVPRSVLRPLPSTRFPISQNGSSTLC
jgi:hypothetical protein